MAGGGRGEGQTEYRSPHFQSRSSDARKFCTRTDSVVCCHFELELQKGQDLDPVGTCGRGGVLGALGRVTREGLRIDEDPLDVLAVFLTQLQVDLTGAVCLGPGATEEQG